MLFPLIKRRRHATGGGLTAPAITVVITSAQSIVTATSPFSITITFSRSVTGFALGDLTVGNGAASNLAGSGAGYTADITPTATGIVTVDIAANVVNEGNLPATQFMIVYMTNLLSFLRLNETSGTNAVDSSGNSRNGTYRDGLDLANTALPTYFGGDYAPLWNATGQDVVNWYTASLSSAFKSETGSISLMAKILDSSIWVDGSTHNLVQFRYDANNYVYMAKMPTNNQLRFNHISPTGSKFLAPNVGGSLDWMHLVITWDINAGASGELKGYLNGLQVGSTVTGIGAWTVNGLDTNYTVIGSVTNTGSNMWKGWLGEAMVFDRALTASEIAAMYAAFSSG